MNKIETPCIIGRLILQGKTISPIRYQKIGAHRCRHIWVINDIHGEYQLLQSCLHQLSFFSKIDLPIFVGNNVDRESESLDVPYLLNQPWFTSVKGNHETIALEASETGGGNMRLASGGGWFSDLNDSERQEAIDPLLKFHHLPHIVKITDDNIKYVIVRADYPGSEYLFGKGTAESELLWSVDRVRKSLNGELQ